jgi:hypothetical protein
VEKELMILVDCTSMGPSKFHVVIVELRDWCGSHGAGRRDKRVGIAENRSTGSQGCAALEESSGFGLDKMDGIPGIPLFD